MPIRVLPPGDQEVVAPLWAKRQVPDGWLYEAGQPQMQGNFLSVLLVR
ncbi:hypothetical protein [Streptomyces lavendofoliae]